MEITALVLVLILEIAMIIGKLEVFSKAGYRWWIGFIPIYSSWILITKVAKMAWYWFVLDLAVFIISSFVENLIILKVFDFAIVFCICYNIAKLFKKSLLLTE